MIRCAPISVADIRRIYDRYTPSIQQGLILCQRHVTVSGSIFAKLMGVVIETHAEASRCRYVIILVHTGPFAG